MIFCCGCRKGKKSDFLSQLKLSTLHIPTLILNSLLFLQWYNHNVQVCKRLHRRHFPHLRVDRALILIILRQSDAVEHRHVPFWRLTLTPTIHYRAASALVVLKTIMRERRTTIVQQLITHKRNIGIKEYNKLFCNRVLHTLVLDNSGLGHSNTTVLTVSGVAVAEPVVKLLVPSTQRVAL